jgi:hypothetical protein
MIVDRKALLFITCSAGVFFRAAAAAEGKSTKGTKSHSNSVPLYFLNPSSCPQKCAQCTYRFLQAEAPQIDGHGTGEAVQTCDAENKHQMWRLHQKDGLTMIESYFNPGDCLAVVPHEEADDIIVNVDDTDDAVVEGDQSGNGGSGTQLDDDFYSNTGVAQDDPEAMCSGAPLGLVPCNDPAAQWLFNGANLISALCWKNGISSFMAVNEECSELSVMAADGGNDALLRSQTFMLTEHASNGVGGELPTEIGQTDIYVPTEIGQLIDLRPASNGAGGNIPSEIGQLPNIVGANGAGRK